MNLSAVSCKCFATVCLQDVEQGLLDQTVSPDAAASMVVAVTSGLGLATVLLASSELNAAQVSQKVLHFFVGLLKNETESCLSAFL